MEETGAEVVAILVGSVLPIVLLGIPFAFGNYFLARRVERASPILWFVLSIIPLVNIVFFYYAAYKVVYAILDYLREIRGVRTTGA